MAKIITILTKRSGDNWVLPPKKSGEPGMYTTFTREDSINTLTPYYEYIESLPGIDYNAYTGSFAGDNAYVSSMVFDTVENAQAAFSALYSADVDNPVVLNYRALMGEKCPKYGIKRYIVE